MASFVEAVKTCVMEKPFNWKDRASRSEFWWCMLFLAIANMIISIFGFIPVLGVIVAFVGGIALGWLNLIVSIRRLHDLNKRGWWIVGAFVPLTIAILLAVIGVAAREKDLVNAASLVSFVAVAFYIYLFVIFCMRGTVGPNRFGPDPLAGIPGATPNMQQPQQAQFFGQNQGFAPNQQGFNPNQQVPQGYAPNMQQPQQGQFFGQNQGFAPNQQVPQGYAPNMQQPQQGQFFAQNQGFVPNQQVPQGFDPNQQAQVQAPVQAPAPAQAVNEAPAQEQAPAPAPEQNPQAEPQEAGEKAKE